MPATRCVQCAGWSATTATTAAELLLLNEIWQLQSQLTNYFYRQPKLISMVRHGAKVSKKHDTATTPFHRAIDHPARQFSASSR